MKLSYSAFFILLFTVFTGCKQDFDITSDYKELPVVYGFLNQQDAKHYIRIQKGYLIDGNAEVAAGITDSIYYPDVLDAKLVPYLDNGSQVGSIITLHRVDGNDPAYNVPKDNGTFANTPNWLYYFSEALDPVKNYQLQVTNTSNNFTFKSLPDHNTPGIKGVKLIKDFSIYTPSRGGNVNLQNSNSTALKWAAAENASVYDLTVRFFYREYSSDNNALLKDTFIDIPLFSSTEFPSANFPTFDLTASNLLGYMARNLETTTAVYREFNLAKCMQFKFAAAGVELNRFVSAQRAQSGLGSNEALPAYTNIDNGAGLLTSRFFKQVDSVSLSVAGFDSLACSSISVGLRFKNKNGQLCQ